MNTDLRLPTEELAQRVLSEVSYDDHIVGVKMAAMGGANPKPLHSLVEAANFMHVGKYEDLMNDYNKATVGYIDPAALSRWIASVLGDHELADAVAARWTSAENYGEAAAPIKELLESRVAQCREVLAGEARAE